MPMEFVFVIGIATIEEKGRRQNRYCRRRKKTAGIDWGYLSNKTDLDEEKITGNRRPIILTHTALSALNSLIFKVDSIIDLEE